MSGNDHASTEPLPPHVHLIQMATAYWASRVKDNIMMLLGPGGQERTVPEYHALLGKAGFRLANVVPTQSAVSIVEAVPA